MHPMLNIAIKAARRAGTIINRASMDLNDSAWLARGRAIMSRKSIAPPRSPSSKHCMPLTRTMPCWARNSGCKVPTRSNSSGSSIPGRHHELYPRPAQLRRSPIALTQRGQVTQAVIYDPSRNELFTASRGSGTFLNDRRVRVSGRTRYHEALLGAHWPNAGDPEAGLAALPPYG